jgi:hypothetical protein
MGMLRVISEWTLDIGEEVCAWFIDWQKAFDRVKWTKLMEILKRSGIDWRERRVMSKLYMDQSVKVLEVNSNQYSNTHHATPYNIKCQPSTTWSTDSAHTLWKRMTGTLKRTQ